MIPAAQIEGKAALLVDFEDRLNIFDTLILCRFYRDLYSWEVLGHAIGLVTGRPAEKEDLGRQAAGIADMTRLFNLREGLKPADDRLPERLHRQKLPSGGGLTAGEMEQLLADYYRIRGWGAEGMKPAAAW